MEWIALAQAVATDPATYPLVSLGVGGGIATLVIGLWRQDRKESSERNSAQSKESEERYERLAKESQDRYAALAKESHERAAEIAADFREIVQENTKAITVLAEKITTGDSVTVRLLVEALRKNKIINVEP